MKLGFIGVGTIAAAMVEGLCAAGGQPDILLSPRNAAISADLAARYAQVQVARSNQAVLDGCNLVVIALRPQVVEAVLPMLQFRPDHQVLSLVATWSLARLKVLTAPASRVIRAVPLPSVAMGQGPTAIFPPDEGIRALFARLGTAVVLEDEAAFDVFTSATATMASYFAFAATISDWMVRQGIAPDAARAFVGQMLQGLAVTGPGQDFDLLAREHQTAGGLNEQVLRHIARDGRLVPLGDALDAVLARLRA